MFLNMTEQQAREKILDLVDIYCKTYHNSEKFDENYLKRLIENNKGSI